jgi:hypothetical protein
MFSESVYLYLLPAFAIVIRLHSMYGIPCMVFHVRYFLKVGTKTSPWSHEGLPGAVEDQPGAIEDHSGTVEAQIEAMEVGPGAVEARPGVLGAHHPPSCSHGAHLGAMEAYSEPVRLTLEPLRPTFSH